MDPVEQIVILGFFFEPLGVLVLAPVDIVIVLAAGAITGIICLILNRKKL